MVTKKKKGNSINIQSGGKIIHNSRFESQNTQCSFVECIRYLQDYMKDLNLSSKTFPKNISVYYS